MCANHHGSQDLEYTNESELENVTEATYSPLTGSGFVCPFLFNYTQDSRKKTWELLEVNDSVAVIIFNISTKKLIFLKQFRPAVYVNSILPEERKVIANKRELDTKKYPGSLGVTLEVCAGVIDGDLTVENIACHQILANCGYKVRPHDLHKVMSYRAGVDIHGSKQIIFFVEVTDEMKCKPAEGMEEKLMEVVEMTIPEVEKYLNNPSYEPVPCPPACLFAIMWFLYFKSKKYN